VTTAWQYFVVAVVVAVAAAYAARTLGPRRWRRKPRGAGKDGSAANCGCDRGGNGCH
jgi:hypothetical protein